LGPGTTTVKAEYTGDGTSGDSISNAVKLSPNGTPPPNFPEGGEFDLSSLQLNGSAVAQSFPNDSFPYLTTGLPNQAGSVFYGAPQNVQAFTTDFWFQFLGVNTADGMTFTIQNDGPEALGSIGGGLGYKGISKSVAVKFDLYNNGGEGDNSTGLYVNGVAPTVPAVDLTPSGIDLHNLHYVAAKEGEVFAVHIAYDGVNLSLTITGQDTQNTFSDSWPIDIPTVVGGTTAYVGFTGGTGGRVSAATILGWTYVPGAP
jgi:Bacterial lectin